MKERLTKILSNYQLSSAQFAEIVGVQRSSISHILSGRNKPSYDFIVKIIEHFQDLNSEWLLTGNGNMLKNPSAAPERTAKTDLFSSNNPEAHKSPSSQGFTPKKPLQNSPDSGPSATQTLYKENPIYSRVTNVNNLKYIIFVYDDNSFEIINKK